MDVCDAADSDALIIGLPMWKERVINAADKLRDAIRSGRIKPPAARLAPETVELLRAIGSYRIAIAPFSWRNEEDRDAAEKANIAVARWRGADFPDMPDADGGE